MLLRLLSVLVAPRQCLRLCRAKPVLNAIELTACYLQAPYSLPFAGVSFQAMKQTHHSLVLCGRLQTLLIRLLQTKLRKTFAVHASCFRTLPQELSAGSVP